MFDRYKSTDWERAYLNSRSRLKVFVTASGCNNMVASEAQHLLKTHYRGPWRMIAAIIKGELNSLWFHYGWPRWNWIRVKVFRRPQDEAIASAERILAEDSELMRIAREI